MPQNTPLPTIHDLFRRQAQRTPNVVALTDKNRSCTYQELDMRTDTVAAQLQAHGVHAETIVGCMFNDSYSTVIAILAVLKAGGAYLLLDRKLPAERLRYLLDDAQPLLILTSEQVPLNGLQAQQTVTIEQLLKTTDLTPTPPQVTADNLAYIAYTSGSTGKPKGVMITHGSTVNHALAYKALFQLAAGDRAPLMAPAAFDMATEEIIPPLLSGCTLVDSRALAPTMAEFTQSVIADGYTFLNIPAPLWHEWTTYLRVSQSALPPKLRFIIVGSDKIYTSRYVEWQSLPGANDVQWVAAYGVTEATVTSTLYVTAAEDNLNPNDEPYMPIGTPINGVTAHIIDDDGQEVANGKTGELYIGGVGIARGYLNLPEKTAEQFIPDHFSNELGARLYKTGDLVQQLPNGTLVWLGRKDDQIKINGLRIEPAEIESTLESYAKIDTAIVVCIPSKNLDEPAILIGFITSTPNSKLNMPYVYSLLRSRLPGTMVPAKLILLDAMPLNTNGKLDRKALLHRAKEL